MTKFTFLKNSDSSDSHKIRYCFHNRRHIPIETLDELRKKFLDSLVGNYYFKDNDIELLIPTIIEMCDPCDKMLAVQKYIKLINDDFVIRYFGEVSSIVNHINRYGTESQVKIIINHSRAINLVKSPNHRHYEAALKHDAKYVLNLLDKFDDRCVESFISAHNWKDFLSCIKYPPKSLQRYVLRHHNDQIKNLAYLDFGFQMNYIHINYNYMLDFLKKISHPIAFIEKWYKYLEEADDETKSKSLKLNYNRFIKYIDIEKNIDVIDGVSAIYTSNYLPKTPEAIKKYPLLYSRLFKYDDPDVSLEEQERIFKLAVYLEPYNIKLSTQCDEELQQNALTKEPTYYKLIHSCIRGKYALCCKFMLNIPKRDIFQTFALCVNIKYNINIFSNMDACKIIIETMF